MNCSKYLNLAAPKFKGEMCYFFWIFMIRHEMVLFLM